MAATPLQVDPQNLRCPTCAANQPWSDTCRRCKCDLALFRSAVAACLHARRLTLEHLRAGRFSAALAQARRLEELHPSDQSARLLAVCHLLRGNWEEALSAAQRREIAG